MKVISFLTLSFFFFFNCTQTIYLKEKIDNDTRLDLLDKNVEIEYKNGKKEKSFLHNISDSIITTINRNDDNKIVIKHIPLADLKKINDKNPRANLAGFILGYAPAFLMLSGAYGSNTYTLIFPLFTGNIGRIIGNNINVNKSYVFENLDQDKFQLGINLGLSLSFINQSGPLESATKIGNDIGLILNHNFSEHHSIQYTISYLHSGARWGGYVILEGNYIDYDMTFINTSVSLKSNILTSSINDKFMLCLGLFYEYNLTARQKWIIEDYSYDEDSFPSNLSSEINKNAFGILAGIQIPFFYDEMKLNMLWYYNFSPLFKDNRTMYQGDFPDKSNFHKNMFIFSIDYLFIY